MSNIWFFLFVVLDVHPQVNPQTVSGKMDKPPMIGNIMRDPSEGTDTIRRDGAVDASEGASTGIAGHMNRQPIPDENFYINPFPITKTSVPPQSTVVEYYYQEEGKQNKGKPVHFDEGAIKDCPKGKNHHVEGKSSIGGKGGEGGPNEINQQGNLPPPAKKHKSHQSAGANPSLGKKGAGAMSGTPSQIYGKEGHQNKQTKGQGDQQSGSLTQPCTIYRGGKVGDQSCAQKGSWGKGPTQKNQPAQISLTDKYGKNKGQPAGQPYQKNRDQWQPISGKTSGLTSKNSTKGQDFPLDGGKGSSNAKAMQPKDKGKSSHPYAQTKCPPKTPSLADQTQSKAKPTSLQEIGPPRYDPEDRVVFCKLEQNSPWTLRRFVACTVLQNPEASNKVINRVLFNQYGARPREICQLFGCSAIREVIGEINKSYQLPDGEEEGLKPFKPFELSDSEEDTKGENEGTAMGPRSRPKKPYRFSKGKPSKSKSEQKQSSTPGMAVPSPSCGEEKENPWIEALLRLRTKTDTGMQTEPQENKTCQIKAPPHQSPSQNPNPHQSIPASICQTPPAQPSPAIYNWMPQLQEPEEIITIHDQTATPMELASPNSPQLNLQGSPQNPLSGRHINSTGTPQPEQSGSKEAATPNTAPTEKPQTPSPPGPIRTTNKAKQAPTQNSVQTGPAGTPVKQNIKPPSQPICLSAQENTAPHDRSGGEGASIDRPADNMSSDVFKDISRFGSWSQMNTKEREVVIRRTPTRMTPQEREYSRQCSRSYPPSTKKHSFHPIAAPLMIRCPIGGGTCGHSLINIKNPKSAVFTHFSTHHRDGLFYHIKIEASHKGFLYTSFPGPSPPSDTQGDNSFSLELEAETAGARRRRQRLYPRLAGYAGQHPTVSLAQTTRLGVEDLLTGSLRPSPTPTEQEKTDKATLQSSNPEAPVTTGKNVEDKSSPQTPYEHSAENSVK